MAIGFILWLAHTKSRVIYWLHFVILIAIFFLLACIFCFAYFSLQFEPDIANKFKFQLIHDNLAKSRSFTARTKPNIDGFYWKSSSSYRRGIHYFNQSEREHFYTFDWGKRNGTTNVFEQVWVSFQIEYRERHHSGQQLLLFNDFRSILTIRLVFGITGLFVFGKFHLNTTWLLSACWNSQNTQIVWTAV